jgi:hypothetical protein
VLFIRCAPSEPLSERLINGARAHVSVCVRERGREGGTGMQIIQLQQPLKAEIISEISVSLFESHASLGMNSHSRLMSAVTLAY